MQYVNLYYPTLSLQSSSSDMGPNLRVPSAVLQLSSFPPEMDAMSSAQVEVGSLWNGGGLERSETSSCFVNLLGYQSMCSIIIMFMIEKLVYSVQYTGSGLYLDGARMQ